MFGTFFEQLFAHNPFARSAAKTVTGRMHQADAIPNQDSSFVLNSPDHEPRQRRKLRNNRAVVRGVRGLFAIGVFDGHGSKGHEASALAAERMQYALRRISDDQKNMSLEDTLRRAFDEVISALNSAPCSAGSGTTGSVVVVRNDDVVVANVGDSAVYCVSRTKWTRRRRVHYASPMHRPTNPAEAERIKLCGGRVQDGYVVDEYATQGIGVSRTIGDRDMRQYGCIPDPTYHSFKLEGMDYAFVVASDGLWDVPGLDNEAVVLEATGGLGVNPRQVCNRLQRMARVQEGPADDCTIACMIVI
ncbi:protein phosphatase 2C containing protein [Gracilaria domingensis]|nr:protein phosphatase 2C containing protein [Gracilaria domingensis]